MNQTYRSNIHIKYTHQMMNLGSTPPPHTVRRTVCGTLCTVYTVPHSVYCTLYSTPPAPAPLAHNCTVACTLLHTLARPSLPVGCKPTASHTSLGYKPYTTPMGGNGCLGVFSGTTNHSTMRLPLELLTASPSGPAQLHKSPSTGPLPGTCSFFFSPHGAFFLQAHTCCLP